FMRISRASPRPRYHHSFPTRRSSDLSRPEVCQLTKLVASGNSNSPRWTSGFAHGAPRTARRPPPRSPRRPRGGVRERQEHGRLRSEEHTSELQSRENLVCRLLLEKKK